MRKLMLTIISCLLFPGYLWALGLGQLEVQSGLNQPLQAQIPLLLGPNEQPSDIQVQLASVADFAKQAIPRPTYLTELQFKISNTKPQPVIQITTQYPVTEPAWHFLLKVATPAGHVIHSFTLLVDPVDEITQANSQALHGSISPQEQALTVAEASIERGLLNQAVVADVEQELKNTKQAYADLQQAHTRMQTELSTLKQQHEVLQKELELKISELTMLRQQVADMAHKVPVARQGGLPGVLVGFLILLVMVGGVGYLVKTKRLKLSRLTSITALKRPWIVLADEDVIATKLEMARSCIEIGAMDDAKKILLDVQKLGDEAQRKEAVHLLERII